MAIELAVEWFEFHTFNPFVINAHSEARMNKLISLCGDVYSSGEDVFNRGLAEYYWNKYWLFMHSYQPNPTTSILWNVFQPIQYR